MARRPPRQPLIAIIGATGTGKSELAIALAKRFGGEIINGDAMQLYAGLPIITNKITGAEQQGIPHHLLGCIGLQEQTWVVSTFVRKALKVIEEIRSRGKLPVLVGGTHYYTQSLLFRDSVVEEDRQDGQEEAAGIEASDDFARFPVLEQPTEVLLAELQNVDPEIAGRWHPKDRRKIQRSLAIYLKTGRTASETYAEQQRDRAAAEGTGEEGGSAAERSLRFPTLVFWVHAEQVALRQRLNSRVDRMFEAGLLDEVRTLEAYAAAEAAAGRPVDETRGIWVSIGYKEFKEYIHALQIGSSDEKELQKLKAEALEKTKAATRQYAKRQLRWIRIKLLNALPASSRLESLYLLDSSDVAAFASTVIEPAAELTEAFLTAARAMPVPASLSTLAAAELAQEPTKSAVESSADWSKQHCVVCGVTCVIEAQWLQHVGSKAHKKKVSKRRQKDAMESATSETQHQSGQRSGDGIVAERSERYSDT